MSNIATRQQFSLTPGNFEQAMALAKEIAKSELVPKHLQGKPADCLLVIEQAMRWNLSPFAAAQETSVIQGKLMYSGKLTAAVVNALGNLAGRLSYYYEGSGENRSVHVVGRFADENESRGVVVTLKEAKTNNPMWTKQPDQQLAYFGARKWARLHAPDLMLGIYSPEDDMEEAHTSRRPMQVAPNVMQALPAPVPHDPVTGEVIETAASLPSPDATELAASQPHTESAAGDTDQDPDLDPALKFIEDTKMSIREFDNPQKLTKWWNSDAQKTARSDYEITKEQSEELRNLVVARRDELMKGEAA